MVLFTIVILFLIVLFVTGKNKGGEKIVITPTPTTTLVTPTPEAPYFLNQLTASKPSVNGTAWIGDKLYYSNSSGVYDALNNTLIKKGPVVYISWSENGKAVLFDGKEWGLFEVSSKNERVLVGDFAYPKISPNGYFVVDCKGPMISIYNTNDSSIVEKDAGVNLSKCLWSESSDFIAALVLQNKNYTIKIFNDRLEEQGLFESTDPTELVSVSQNADNVLIEQMGTLKIVGGSGVVTTLYSNPKSKYLRSINTSMIWNLRNLCTVDSWRSQKHEGYVSFPCFR